MRHIRNSDSFKRIVVTESALFVCAKNYSATVLLIKISYSHIQAFIVVPKKAIWDTTAFIFFKCLQRIKVAFITKSGRKISGIINKISKTIHQHFLRNVVCVDERICFVILSIQLKVAVQ